MELPPGLVELDRFARDRNPTAEELDALVDRLSLLRLPSPGRTFAVLPATRTRFGGEVKAALATFHAATPDQPGIPADRVRAALPTRIPAIPFAAMLQALQKLDAAVVEGGRVRLPSTTVGLPVLGLLSWRRSHDDNE